MPDAPLPPCCPADEKTCLGCIFDSANAGTTATVVAECLEILPEPEAFYVAQYRIIWQAVVDITKSGCQIDLEIVARELASSGRLAEIGGEDEIVNIFNARSAWENATYYAKLVRDCWDRRRAISVGHDLDASARNGSSFPKAVESARRRLIELEQGGESRVPPGIGDMLNHVQADFDSGNLQLMPTGIVALDAVMHGYPVCGLTLIAGRPGMGKSTLMLTSFRHCVSAGRKACFFSLEMSPHEIAVHLVAASQRIPGERIRLGQMPPEDRQAAFEAASRLFEGDSGWIYTDKSSMPQIEAEVRRLHDRHALSCVFVDYAQLLVKLQRGRTEDQVIGEITRGMKLLAQELGISVIAGSQLNREVERRQDKRPLLSDLRASGNLEQDANCVLLMYRPAAYDQQADFSDLQVRVAKQRMGRLGQANLIWNPAYHRVESLAQPVPDDDTPF